MGKHVVQGGDTNVVPDRRPPHNRRDPTRSGGAHFSLSQDHLGEEPLNLRSGPTPTSRDLCRFCLSWPGHTNRRQPSLSAVIAGIRPGQGNGQGLSGQIASPRLAKGGEKIHGPPSRWTCLSNAQFDTAMCIPRQICYWIRAQLVGKLGSGGYQASTLTTPTTCCGDLRSRHLSRRLPW